MKKIDKLILTSFLGPFVLTFFVVVFVLLTQHMLKYFDDIIGKDLGWDVVGTLLFYFGIFMTPVALPLAVLLSALITFGNLGEHFELTAIKSLGISLVRSLFPIFITVLLITMTAFYVNNTLVPKAALEAYSLLYDIKQKKPSLDLREGTFYSAIPDVSIKVNDKLPDGQTLKDVIIYDHRGRLGNRDVTVADSGRMYTILNDQYLKLELFSGYNYSEDTKLDPNTPTQTLSKTKFDKTQIVFDLSSFGMSRTDKKWFQGNRLMRNISELEADMDSVGRRVKDNQLNEFTVMRDQMFAFHHKQDTIELPTALAKHQRRRDSLEQLKPQKRKTNKPLIKSVPTMTHQEMAKTYSLPTSDSARSAIAFRIDSIFSLKPEKNIISGALAHARMIKGHIVNFDNQTALSVKDFTVFRIQWHKILASSIACIAMFLIGAPLGAIIKRGGLGFPVLISILLFIIYYVITMTGEKWAKQGVVSVPLGIWIANIILFSVGFIFLFQARQDARLFEADFYNVWWDKAKIWFKSRKLMVNVCL